MRGVRIGRQLVVTFPAYCIQIVNAMGFGWAAVNMQHFLSSEYPTPFTTNQCTFLFLILHIGRIVGACINITIFNHRGCKLPMIIGCVLFLISYIITYTKHNFSAVLFARLLYGIGITACESFVTIYIGEISHKKIRGANFSISALTFGAGVTLQFAMGCFLTYQESLILSITLCLIALLSTYFLIETPYFWVTHNKPDQALKTINWLEKLEPKQADKELEEICKMECKQTIGQFLKHFKSPEVYKSYGINLTLGFLATVINIIYISFANFLIPDTKYLSADHFAIFSNIILMCVSTVSIFCIDRFRRRSLLIFGFSIGILINSIVTVLYYVQDKSIFDISYFSWIVFIISGFYLVTYGLSVNITVSTLRSEMFPIGHKNFGINAIAVTNSLTNLILISVVLKLAFKYGNYIIFLMFCIVNLVGLVFVFHCLPETKGKSLAEIQNILKS